MRSSPEDDWSEHSFVFGGVVSIGEEILRVLFFWINRRLILEVLPLREKGYKCTHSQGLFEVIGNEVDL